MKALVRKTAPSVPTVREIRVDGEKLSRVIAKLLGGAK
ncbi:hypothetical protein FHR36_002373 [Kitasatospora paracochleata]|uniref:Uncharacterized protein n=1 Tax=Kitasatospora paracochleata TaxID=58354 RepID=A0ABT1IVT1_9ACTN|nr:hypothetical protein [Kitasatospora paracochleata]